MPHSTQNTRIFQSLRSRSPLQPLRRRRAGASIVHLHVRDPETGEGSRDVNLFRETVARVREYETDVVINLTAGMGAILLPDPEDESKALPESDVIGVEERIEHLVDCLPELASLDVTTGNQQEGSMEFVYLNADDFPIPQWRI